MPLVPGILFRRTKGSLSTLQKVSAMNKQFWLYHRGAYHSDHDSRNDAFSAIIANDFDVNECRIVNAFAEISPRSKAKVAA